MRLTVLLIILFIVTVVFIIDIMRRRKGDSGVVEHFITDVVPIFHKQTPHCNSPQLLFLMKSFNSYNFEAVEKLLLGFTDDYRSFGFDMLSAMGDKTITQTWVDQSNSEVPYILMGMHLIDEAWEVRGGDFADTLSTTQEVRFHELLTQAEKILTSIPNTNSAFEVSRLVALLQVHKGLSFETITIQEIFDKAVSIAPYHIGLHIEYFDAISPKWGGTDEEVERYLNDIMPSEPKLLSDCILALYYRDLLHVSSVESAGMLKEIKDFVVRISSEEKKIENLHYVDLYEYMAQISFVQSPFLVTKYEELIEETFQKWY